MATFSVVIGVVAAYWAYQDARGRGHDLGIALLWSAGILAAFYIFLPLYLLLGRTSPGKPHGRCSGRTVNIEAIPSEEAVNCPMCSNAVREDFNACPYCGFSLKPVCACCSTGLKREWRLCPYCQSPVGEK